MKEAKSGNLDLIVAVDIPGLVRQQCRGVLGVDGEHALLAFVGEVRLQLGPHRLGALRRRGEKFFIARIGRDVTDDKVTHVDGRRPVARLETPPAIACADVLLQRCAARHGASPLPKIVPA
jgi:hypothetical protein